MQQEKYLSNFHLFSQLDFDAYWVFRTLVSEEIEILWSAEKIFP